MTRTPHASIEDLPEMTDRVHEPKTTDDSFVRLVEEYHEVNRAIHRIETRAEPASEDAEAALKRRRLRLKDEIASMLGRDAA